jgi:gluconate transporter
MIAEFQPLIATICGVAALLILILWARMNAFVALLLVAIFSAIAGGMTPEAALDTVSTGMGGTLGFIAIIIGLGALFGAFLEASGGVASLASRLLEGRSVGSARWVMALTGLLASIPVFFDVALIILAPLVFAASARLGRPAMSLGLPLLAGLAVAHAFIPPTPGPIAVAQIVGADLGWVIGFGLITGAVAVAAAGPLYTAFLDRSSAMPVGDLARPLDATTPGSPQDAATAAPAFGASRTALLIALPLVLILGGTLAKAMIGPEAEGAGLLVRHVFTLVGHPFMALIIACGAGYWSFQGASAAQKARLTHAVSKALEPTGAVILVTGAGGAFKQVLVETGAGGQLAEAALGLGLTPIVAAYLLTLLVRVAQGSATVAMITGAGLVAPFAQSSGASQPELALIVLACAAGASALSHVNDSGFWLVGRIFGLTPKETLKTWTASVTVASLAGFAAILVLAAFL